MAKKDSKSKREVFQEILDEVKTRPSPELIAKANKALQVHTDAPVPWFKSKERGDLETETAKELLKTACRISGFNPLGALAAVQAYEILMKMNRT